MRYTRVALSVLALALTVGAQGSSSSSLTLEHFERLSFDVRGHRLRPVEREAVEFSVKAGGLEAEAFYSSLVDEWLDRDAFKRYVGTFLQFPNVAVTDATAETFFHRLSRHGEGESAVYSLPHTVPDGSPGPPCAAAERVSVAAWWQDEPIAVCPDSYRPAAVFDEIGYCSGEAEPLMRQPPRPGCGCGPVLMGCLPPRGDAPRLDALVDGAAEDEWFETAARIVAEGRSLDELLTTSRTWQTGLAEFLYLRRELLGELNAVAWTPSRDVEIRRRVAEIDVHAPGRWVERTGIYAGTGIWWTSLAPHALKVPVRGVSHHLLARHLGSDFHAVNVDAAAVLEAVGRNEENLRTLSSITAAPMRYTRGCRGCHAPMDGVAGFLGELQGPMYGSFPTGRPGEGEFFVSGAEDFRGKGQGAAQLGQLVIAQPEFETVSVRRAFEEVMLRPLSSRDQPLFEDLVEEFSVNGHRWRPVIEELLESEAYKNPGAPAATGAPPVGTTMSETIPSVVSSACVRCHDEFHDTLDLRELPPKGDVAAWTRIWSRVTDYSMPPPEFDGKVTGRFPLDPAIRRRFVAAVEQMLGPALDRPTPPRHLDSRAWISVVRDVAGPELPGGDLDRLTEPLVERVVLRRQPRRGYVPALQLTLERISEEVCRAVAASGSEAYGLHAPGAWKNGGRTRSVETLLARVHGRSPTDEELGDASALLGRFEELTGDSAESWVGLCSTSLTGPRLMFELYARSDGGTS